MLDLAESADLRSKLDTAVGEASLAAVGSTKVWSHGDTAELRRGENRDRWIIVAAQVLPSAVVDCSRSRGHASKGVAKDRLGYGSGHRAAHCVRCHGIMQPTSGAANSIRTDIVLYTRHYNGVQASHHPWLMTSPLIVDYIGILPTTWQVHSHHTSGCSEEYGHVRR